MSRPENEAKLFTAFARVNISRRTIINLAHSLKLNVVAEGVETEEQSQLLRLLNCDEMQGFLFCKPVPSDTFETRFLAPPSAE